MSEMKGICICNSMVCDISKLSVTSRAERRRVIFGEFWNIKERYLCQILPRNYAVICLWHESKKLFFRNVRWELLLHLVASCSLPFKDRFLCFFQHFLWVCVCGFLHTLLSLVMERDPRGGVIGLEPFGHPKIWHHSTAARKELLVYSPVVERFFGLGRVEGVQLHSLCHALIRDLTFEVSL